ncbi:hypothetical protein D3C87_1851630 [compost metagenome]
MGLVRSSESAVGATMFCTHSSCYLCAVDIVDAGIVEFVFRDFYRTNEGLKHFLKAGVKVMLQYGDEFTELQLQDLASDNTNNYQVPCGTCTTIKTDI